MTRRSTPAPEESSQLAVTRFTDYSDLPQWLSIEEVQAFLGIGRSTAYDLAKSGNVARAREIQMRALALEELLKPIGTFPCNLKAAMNLLGRPGGSPRKPMLPLTPAQTDQVQVVLHQLNLAVTPA